MREMTSSVCSTHLVDVTSCWTCTMSTTASSIIATAGMTTERTRRRRSTGALVDSVERFLAHLAILLVQLMQTMMADLVKLLLGHSLEAGHVERRAVDQFARLGTVAEERHDIAKRPGRKEGF